MPLVKLKIDNMVKWICYTKQDEIAYSRTTGHTGLFVKTMYPLHYMYDLNSTKMESYGYKGES